MWGRIEIREALCSLDTSETIWPCVRQTTHNPALAMCNLFNSWLTYQLNVRRLRCFDDNWWEQLWLLKQGNKLVKSEDHEDPGKKQYKNCFFCCYDLQSENIPSTARSQKKWELSLRLPGWKEGMDCQR